MIHGLDFTIPFQKTLEVLQQRFPDNCLSETVSAKHIDDIDNSEEQRLTIYTGNPLSSTTFLILKIKFFHLRLLRYFPCH
jgi:hypothetical protein